MEIYSYPYTLTFVISDDGRLLLLAESGYERYGEPHKAYPLSRNPHYINWLRTNRNIIQECYDKEIWFKSEEHSDGDTKYFEELNRVIDHIHKK